MSVRARRPGFLRRFGRDRDGATAVEFAMIAAPFFFMLFALLEVGHLFILSSTLENATMDASRQIRTGQLQDTGGTEEQFKTLLCGRMSIFEGQCEANLEIDVRVLPQFSTPTPDPMADGETFNEGALTFEPGGREDIILVRAWWRQPLFTPMMSQALSRLEDGRAVLTSAAAFRNEPF